MNGPELLLLRVPLRLVTQPACCLQDGEVLKVVRSVAGTIRDRKAVDPVPAKIDAQAAVVMDAVADQQVAGDAATGGVDNAVVVGEQDAGQAVAGNEVAGTGAAPPIVL